MSNKRAHFSTLGEEQFTVRFSLSDLSGQAKANLFRALLADAGALEGIKPGDTMDAYLTGVMNVLWNQKD